jgi:hypothetical protein
MLSSARFATASASDHNRSQRYNQFSRAGAERRRRIIAVQCATHSHSKQRAQHAAARRQPCGAAGSPARARARACARVPLSASSRGYETCAASVPRNMYLKGYSRGAAQHRNGATQQRSPRHLKGGALCCAANGRGLSRLWLNRPYSVQGCRAVHQGTLPWYTCAGGWKQWQLVYVRLLRAEEDPARAVVQRHIDRACSAVQCSAVQCSAVAASVAHRTQSQVSLLCFRRGPPVLFAVCYRWHRLPIRQCRPCRQCSLLHVQCL